ncbi:hypothetical protein SYNPS1DRAFT_24155 [Syncephalis pseudoplumigaleata]|uniref:Uncharacterized protein n=1 Tax=Syncephalis pseudoplumigaleata TaxID=1712513 RepID=A0A4P9YWS4_9FUNG|nr:hypothetical protein SYNPS1DRAFT_24155 [Syncephalis pseudoplumigaleata]|eukprot:RKP23771.1 hypothetical protein SYNPS1DRAFT_24155 [Syncephalis pseudoplumigaleata]
MTLPSLNLFQTTRNSINETLLWTIPEVHAENCTIARWDSVVANEMSANASGTVVSFDMRSIWDASCTSYHQIIEEVLRNSAAIIEAGFPPLRGIVLPSPLPDIAAGGPDDAYCGGGRIVDDGRDSTTAILEMGRQSLLNASKDCIRSWYANGNGQPVAVVVIGQAAMQQLEQWYNERMDEDVVHTVRARITDADGLWNHYFNSDGYQVYRYTEMILVGIQRSIRLVACTR